MALPNGGSTDVSGSGAGRGGIADMVARASRVLSRESHWFLCFAFAALVVLAYAARINHEPVASAVGIVVTAVFGGGALKNYADQKFTNGNGTK